jgi:tetratricopeptide (TPR) repeat protein
MITSSIFNFLEIEETRDENVIKDAYRKKLIAVNPEDNPEGFVQLREAYEEALRLAKEGDSPEWAIDTPVGKWTQQIDDIYSHFDRRKDIACWEKLFDNSFFRNLDTEDEAKRALLSYLTRHYYLPQAIWRLIEDKCEIELRMDEYTESFPREFLRFIIDNRTVAISIPLELFVGGPDSDYDSYIQKYFNLLNIISAEDSSGATKLFDELEHADISHPYLLGERIRYAVKMNDTVSVRKWMDAYESNPSPCRDAHLLHIVGQAHWALGEYDKSRDYANQALDVSPENYGAKKLLCDYDAQNNEYEKAHEAYIKLLDINPFDPDLSAAFKKNVAGLIEFRLKKIAENPTVKERIELCWHYYQTNEFQKALDTLLPLKPETEEDDYSFTNLIGRLYVILEQYEVALPHLIKWKEYIDSTVDDHSEKSRNKLNRKGTAHYFIAEAWFGRAKKTKAEEDFSTALTYYNAAITYEKRPMNFQYKGRKAELLLAADRNEECIDYCTRQIEEFGNIPTFYIYRQQASYNLKLGHDVINDFYSISRIAPFITKPYVLTADAYLNVGQFKEALGIIEQARQVNINTPKLRLIEIAIHRLQAADLVTTKACIKDLEALDAECKKMEPKDCDIEDLKDIRLQICYAHMDQTNLKDAKRLINRLISEDPDNETFARVLSDIYLMSNLVFEAETTLRMFLQKHSNTLPILINLGDVFMRSNKYDAAVETYQNIIAIAPTHTLPNKMLSKIYLKKNVLSPKGEFLKKALEYANKQISISGDPENFFQRGLIHLEIGNLNEAIEDFTKVLELDSGNAALCYGCIGDGYKYQREFDKALANYKNSYKLFEGKYEFYICKDLSICYESMYRYDEAIKMLDIISENQPELIEAYNNQARIYIKMKKYQEALFAYRIALLNSNTIYLRAEAYRNMVICNLLMKRKFSAWTILQKSEFGQDVNGIYYQTFGDYLWYTKRSSFRSIMKYKMGYSMCKGNMGKWEAANQYAHRFLEIYHYKKRIKTIQKHRTMFFKALNAKFGDVNAYISHPHERKQRCFIVGRVLYYSGEIEEARKLFDQMDTGKNCIYCSYSKCVESIVGHAMLLESEGRYEEAIVGYEEVIAEGYECEKYIPHVQMLQKKANLKS